MRINRRAFMKWFSGTALGMGLAGSAYALAEPYRERVVKYVLETPRWPASHPPFTIAAVGDLHVGSAPVGLERVAGIVERLNAMEADVIVLLGDFLASPSVGGTYVEPAPIAAALSALKARHGVYAVLGNHDWNNDGPGMWKALETAGIRVLENNAATLTLPGGHVVAVAGLADDMTRAPDLQRTLAECPDDAPVIMLSHDPATFLEMDGRPVVTLCGHTHGGQMAMPFIGAIVVPGRAPLRYAYGHIQEEGRDLIVTSGIGITALPIRAFACPELVHVTVSAKPA